MIITKANTSESLLLQVLPQTPDGIPKNEEITIATVRVYHINAGAEVEDLVSTSLVHVPASKAWRVIWTPSSLAEGHYVIEYTLEDTDGVIAVSNEDLIVGQLVAPTVEEIDTKLTEEHGNGDWTTEVPPSGNPTVVAS
jgi:hypothetical protein